MDTNALTMETMQKKAKSPLTGVHSIEGSMYGGSHCVHGDSIIPAK